MRVFGEPNGTTMYLILPSKLLYITPSFRSPGMWQAPWITLRLRSPIHNIRILHRMDMSWLWPYCSNQPYNIWLTGLRDMMPCQTLLKHCFVMCPLPGLTSDYWVASRVRRV